jgi:hypothetical protein
MCSGMHGGELGKWQLCQETALMLVKWGGGGGGIFLMVNDSAPVSMF